MEEDRLKELLNQRVSVERSNATGMYNVTYYGHGLCWSENGKAAEDMESACNALLDILRRELVEKVDSITTYPF